MKWILSFCFLLCSVAPSGGTSSESYVYICTGRKAYSYHCRSNCHGLNRCKAEIKRVSLSYAKSIRRSPCGICYK